MQFTFHYVSIKSVLAASPYRLDSDLHSTMYLLNPMTLVFFIAFMVFTFHYVSIKSDDALLAYSMLIKFTFHYVSIKSQLSELLMVLITNLHSTMYLLNL